MKQVFILNPAAGKGAPALRLREQINAVFAGRDVEICVTDAPGEATSLARSRAMQGNPVRFYACGGDGTLHEVVAGVQGCQNAEVACVPCGSANDFVRIFRGAGSFLDLSAQAAGLAVPLDGIDCGGKLAIGLCALGMDATVAYKMIRYKHLPLVSGPMAYNLAIVDCFLHRIGCDLEGRMAANRWRPAGSFLRWRQTASITAAATAVHRWRRRRIVCWILYWSGRCAGSGFPAF